jgi:uncharacterized protein
VKIAIIGATGFVGSQILNEALSRGHEVTAIVRRVDKMPEHPALTGKAVDIMDVDALAAALAGHEAVIAAFNADRTLPGDVFERMVDGAKAIIAATKKAGVKRLLAVGGAGSLLVAPGQQLIDSPDFPPAWKAGAGGTREFLYLLKEESAFEWTFLSPAAMLQPGERTGTFRLGGDELLLDDKGECRISTADYAVAMIDELEEPRNSGQRFSVAY